MMPERDCYRFESRMGIMAKIFPAAASANRKSGSRPEWRFAMSGARVFAAAIASSLVANVQISWNRSFQPID
jgi:hypothetical protein